MIVIDAHVHIHDCFDLDVLFSAAWNNFRAAADPRVVNGRAVAFLLLTEGSGQHRFREIQSRENFCTHWRGVPTLEPDSLRLENGNCRGLEMFLAAGRQIVTSEKLEVLALLSGEEFEEGRPLGLTVREVRNRGAIPVLPWGAGKWMGRRKRVLSGFLERDSGRPLFLADNRCRPGLWRLPEFARKGPLKVLGGTDPLPFRWEERRAGSFGSILRRSAREIDGDRPVASLKHLLSDPAIIPEPFGHSEAAFDFIRNQAAMQIRKHFLV